jgi:hypothetical protein
MASKEELTIQPGQSYDLSFKNGDYSFIIMHQEGIVFTDQEGIVFTDNDLDVTMQAGDTSSVDSGDNSKSVSISASSDEEDSGSSGSSWWGGAVYDEDGFYVGGINIREDGE